MERAACYYPDSENLEQIARRYKGESIDAFHLSTFRS